MNVKKITALFLILLLIPAAGLAQPTFQMLPETVPINRNISKNTAKTLDNLPDIARGRTDSIVLGTTDLLGEFNPFWAETTGDNYVASLLFDELLFANNLGETGAGIASYTLSEDGKMITFTLRENARYSDGAQVMSDDFINAFYLLLMPGYDGVYDLLPADIAGVEAYLSGDAASIEGIQRVSDRAFSVTLLSPATSRSLFLFAVPALRVSVFGDMKRPEAASEKAAAEAFYAQTLRQVRDADATAMAYGQYTYVSHEAGTGAVLEWNESYWRAKPYIRTVEIKVVPYGNELAAIMSGEVDIISMIGSVDAVDVVADMESGMSFVNLYTFSGDVVGYLGMDLQNPLFADRAVRRALAMGFDRDGARYDSIERYGTTLGAILFDSFDVSSSKLLGEQYAYSRTQAAELLADAGWQKNEEGLLEKEGRVFSFTLTYNEPNPIMDVFAQRMQSDYLALGIEVNLELVPFEALLEKIDAGECEMYFQARRMPSSPAVAAGLFAGESHLNDSGYASDMTDRLLSMARGAGDAERQTVVYELLFQELYLDLPFIPLYRRSEFLLVNARIMNVTITTAHEITADMFRMFITDTLEGQW